MGIPYNSRFSFVFSLFSRRLGTSYGCRRVNAAYGYNRFSAVYGCVVSYDVLFFIIVV